MTANSIPHAGNILQRHMDNGITLLAYENAAVQSVNIVGSLQAGSIYEPPGQSGLASMLAGALMTGSERRDFDEMHSALENIGADLSFSAQSHKLVFAAKSLAEDLGTIIALANEALREPAFPLQHIERLRGERLTWLQYRQYDTRSRAARAMREALYPPEHPYHHSSAGKERSIAALTRDDLCAFHQSHVGPRGMILVIVGAVQAEAALDMAEAAFGEWRLPQQSAPLTVAAPPPRSGRERQIVHVPGKTQSDICMATVGPARQAEDYLAAQLANSVLGEFGMMGRIGKTVREEQGLAYYAYSRIGGGNGPKPWHISAGVNPDNVERAIESCIAQLERISGVAVSAEELGDNQSYFTGRMPLRLERNEGIAGQIHAMQSFGLGLDYLAGYAEQVRAISAEDVLQAAQRYLRLPELVVAVAGPHASKSGLPG